MKKKEKKWNDIPRTKKLKKKLTRYTKNKKKGKIEKIYKKNTKKNWSIYLGTKQKRKKRKSKKVQKNLYLHGTSNLVGIPITRMKITTDLWMVRRQA